MLIIALFYIQMHFGAATTTFTFAPMITGTVLLYGRHVHLPQSTARLFNYLGEISYPMYLCHIAVYVILAAHARAITDEHSGLPFIVALCSAIAIYHLVDVPIRRIARKSKPIAATEQVTATIAHIPAVSR